MRQVVRNPGLLLATNTSFRCDFSSSSRVCVMLTCDMRKPLLFVRFFVRVFLDVSAWSRAHHDRCHDQILLLGVMTRNT